MMNEKEYFILIKLFFVSKQMKRRKEIFTAIVYMYIIDKKNSIAAKFNFKI